MSMMNTGINKSTDPILSRLNKGRIIKLILLHSPIAASGVAAIASTPSSLIIPEYQKPQISWRSGWFRVMHANARVATNRYDIDIHRYLVLAKAMTNPMPTNSPSMGCALMGCPNFNRKMFLMASTGVAIGSLYTLTIGWIKGREYANSQRPTISPSIRAEAKKRKSVLSV